MMNKGIAALFITKDHIDALMRRVTYVVVQQPGGTNTTFVHAFLDGKLFLATGFCACVEKSHFFADLSEREARSKAEENAESKLVELEGYKLFLSQNSDTYE
ncbi:Gp49 family protein [Acinetobacter soli]|uniref:Gp49 family protein n=1 Tax=Acinetobacter soli TaxID=487316 RepID=UPI00280E45DA|nr:Gp49 family protein [Acinetobacter soli]MDQ8996355.1 Gp49 family protein [Acinetobacter soli]